MKVNEKRISELSDNFKWPNTHVIGVHKGGAHRKYS